MKMRKLFAGIAAAATMLGGLALGATTANAAQAEVSGNGSITLNDAETDHTYKAYKIAGYADPVIDTTENTKATNVTITKVNDNVNNAVQAAALAAWNANNGTDTDLTAAPQPYQDNVAAWVATWGTTTDAAKLRIFTDELATKTSSLDEPVTLTNTDDSTTTSTVPAGWYLVVDTASKKAGKALLVGTTFTVTDTEVKTLGSQTLGQVDVKPTTTPPPTKTVTDGKTSVNVGDTVNYTITGKVPNTIGQTKVTYILNDYPGLGLNIAVNQTNFKVYINGSSTALETGEYTVSADPAIGTDGTVNGAANNGQKISIDLSNYVKTYGAFAGNAGQEIKVTYSATVTADAPKDVNNDIKLDNGSTEEVGGNTVTVHTGSFEFLKWAEGTEKGLAGATFNVYKTKDGDKTGEALTFDKNSGGTVYTYNGTATANDATVVTSVAGKVTVKGLEDGTYRVVETDAPDNYYQNTLGEFNVTIKDGVVTSVEGKDIWGLAESATDTGETVAYAKVKNVKSVGELPKTGAAGIAMFMAVAVLLAGAAATVYAKSRNTKRMLNA